MGPACSTTHEVSSRVPGSNRRWRAFMMSRNTVSQLELFREVVKPGTLAGRLHLNGRLHILHREGLYAALVTDIPGHRADRGDPGVRRACGHGRWDREDPFLRIPGHMARGIPFRPPRNI